MASDQQLLLGPYADGIREGLDDLVAARVFERLWSRDASLWSDDKATQASIAQRLGWLTIADVMARETGSVHRFAQEVRAEGLTEACVLGMGGSGLFAEVCQRTFGTAAGQHGVTVLDTTDPTAILAYQRGRPLRHVLAIVSSKSGSTSEVAALSKYFYEALRSVDGDPGARCIAITDAGTSLEAQAKAWGFRRIFSHGPQTGAEVGGRFSCLTYFGLVPAALMGVDTAMLLRRAEVMLARCGGGVVAAENPAAQLAAALAMLARAGRDKLTLLCTPPLVSFGTWVEQLISESIGKMGQGIAPIHGEPLRPAASYGPDRVFVELRLVGREEAGLDRQVERLVAAGHPVVRISWGDAYDLGAEVAKWFMATAAMGALLGINPFDEPNVKESKDRTKGLLEQYVKDGHLPDAGQILFASQDVAIYGAGRPSAFPSLGECLADFAQRLRSADYIALLSFLPRTAELDDAILHLRRRLADLLPHAMMVGFGPRYLHSTGQLYKGGADAGLFLLFTAEGGEDLPIPGEPFTFGILKQAQALGDFQAMAQRGRRILRVHLRGHLREALNGIIAAVVQAFAPKPER